MDQETAELIERLDEHINNLDNGGEYYLDDVALGCISSIRILLDCTA